MYPTFASPAAALTIAAMMSDEAIATAERRCRARQVREARRAQTRSKARRPASGAKPRVRSVLAAIGIATTMLSGGFVSGASHSSGQVDARRIPLQQLHDSAWYTVEHVREPNSKQFP